uniref:Uncharacterized protein n=1 Tax=viral metagenome TaxID=1070528 RepID=A0A6M3K441_9ZZZZ
MDKSKNGAEPHGSGIGPDAGVSFHGGDFARLDMGAGAGLDLDRGDKAEGVGTVAHARVPEAPPSGRGVAQLEARETHNLEVEGSSPSSATTDTCDDGGLIGAAGAGPDTPQPADPSIDWPWPCSPAVVYDPSELTDADRRELQKPPVSGLFPHQRFT